MLDDNRRFRVLIRNLRLLGSTRTLVRRLGDQPLPKFVRRVIRWAWQLKGLPFYYKAGRLPCTTVGRIVKFDTYTWLFECQLDSDLERHIAIHGEWEPHILTCCRKYIVPGTTVLDIGANIGVHSVAFAAFAGPKGQVLAFEPSPKVAARLAQNLELNRCTNVTVVPLAVSSSSSKDATFFSPTGSNRGLGSLQKNFDLANSEQFSVDTVALDDMVEQLGDISFIKIDIQGHELSALRGMVATIRSHRPVITFELEHEYLNDPARYVDEIHQLFTGLAYRLFAIDGEFLYPLPNEGQFHGDVLALPTAQS